MNILLDSGSGGRASQRLITEVFLRHFDNSILRRMDDAARLELSGPVAMSTDGYTVTPLFFPGGSIGSLAVHGTVNDIAMMGARPRYLSCAFILEEGLDSDVLERAVADMAQRRMWKFSWLMVLILNAQRYGNPGEYPRRRGKKRGSFSCSIVLYWTKFSLPCRIRR